MLKVSVFWLLMPWGEGHLSCISAPYPGALVGFCLILKTKSRGCLGGRPPGKPMISALFPSPDNNTNIYMTRNVSVRHYIILWAPFRQIQLDEQDVLAYWFITCLYYVNTKIHSYTRCVIRDLHVDVLPQDCTSPLGPSKTLRPYNEENITQQLGVWILSSRNKKNISLLWRILLLKFIPT